MRKDKCTRLLLVMVAILLFAASAIAASQATQFNPLGITSIGNMIPNGEYEIYVLTQAKWQQVGKMTFDKFFRERELDLSSFIKDSKEVKVKIIQKGGGAAHIDSVVLGGTSPVAVEGVQDGLKKLSKKDFDVADTFGKEILITFPEKPKDNVLKLTARVENTVISKTPFQFPTDNLCKKMDTDSAFYKYQMTAENTLSPIFKEYSLTGSGHPSGYTYGWVRNDDKNLYVKIDFTPDNTIDGDKDYAKVYVKTKDGLKEFKVSVPETKWGTPDFTYTDNVSYQHKVYDFSIPLKEIGVDVKREKELLLAFAAYGTATPPSCDPSICPNITAECTGGLTQVSYVDSCTYTCGPPSGYFFPKGITVVTCNPPPDSQTCSFTVTVVDTTPPQVTCPADITVDTTSCTTGEVVTYTAIATDSCGLSTFECTPPSGSTLPVGTTPGTCTATDIAGNRASCSFNVDVNCLSNPICRTAGFWQTHAGTECPKKQRNCGSQNITQAVIDNCGECIEICGEVIKTTGFDDADSAVEAMCIPVKSNIELQLARQLTALSLNCCISGFGSDCAGYPAWWFIFSGCNTACASQSTGGYQPCIDALDCLNSGRDLVSIDPVTCQPPLADSCAFQPLCNETMDLCFNGKQEKIAGSANACNMAIKSACTVIPPGEAQCASGTKEDLECCGFCGDGECDPCEDVSSCPDDCLVCSVGETNCSGTCVDTSTDNGNCGSCGTVCTGGETCVSGQCACPAGETNCGGTCVDTSINNSNCGFCGNECSYNIPDCCNGSCTDLQSDNNNCGSCGNGCNYDQYCCSGTCVNFYTDNNNCGSCGNECGFDEECCDGFCRDLQSDNNNCGSCGYNCFVDENCVEGQCVPVSS